jgi:hypothetical protein
VTDRVDAQRSILCKQLDGKVLFTGMLHLYAVIHQQMMNTVQPERKKVEERCQIQFSQRARK